MWIHLLNWSSQFLEAFEIYLVIIAVLLIISITGDDDRPSIDAFKLSTVRMKLEEKRRQIEQDKRKMEVTMSRHQQKVGKAAFLQAINKVCNIYSI